MYPLAAAKKRKSGHKFRPHVLVKCIAHRANAAFGGQLGKEQVLTSRPKRRDIFGKLQAHEFFSKGNLSLR